MKKNQKKTEEEKELVPPTTEIDNSVTEEPAVEVETVIEETTTEENNEVNNSQQEIKDVNTYAEHPVCICPSKPKKLSEMTFKECRSHLERFKWLMNYIFIDGMSGMGVGLFATLIAGTIIWQLGALIDTSKNNYFGLVLEAVGKIAQITTGAGIGVGVCLKLKKKAPLVIVASLVGGMVGSYAKNIVDLLRNYVENPDLIHNRLSISLVGPGDPMGAFIGSMTAMSIASLVSNKTKLDIIVTPLVGILSGSFFGILLGYPVSLGLAKVGEFIKWVSDLGLAYRALIGFVVAIVMGICLTLPISSAAIGISIQLSGIAAGAAVVGCCCQMVGFAVMSFRENRWGGLVSQGIGTSMLQIPNIFKKPVLFVPPIISSGILGLISVFLPIGKDPETGEMMLGLLASKTGSGMGTAGLVGSIDMIFTMIDAKANIGLMLLYIVLFCFVLPGALTLGISEIFRKCKVIKYGDLKLDI